VEPQRRRSSIGPTIGVGEVLVAIGAVVVAVSVVLRWADLATSHIIYRRTARGIPVRVLWDYTTAPNTTPSILVVLIPALLLCGLGLVLRRTRALALVGGLLAGAVGAMYVFQVHQALRSNRASFPGVGLTDFLGPAPWICMVGGAVAALGGLWLALRRPTSDPPAPPPPGG
jgi:hypothetical protein